MSFTNEVWLAIRNDGALGDGRPSNPFEVNTPSRFAEIMGDPNKVPVNAIIRLGPGVFRTRGTTGNGYDMDPALGWSPRSGQRLIGSSMFSTTLQFVWDLDPNLFPVGEPYDPGQRHNMILSDQYLSSFELSDMTLDCNLQNNPTPFGPTKDSGPTVTASAVGTTITASGPFFTWSMVGSTIVFANGVSARIMTYIDTLHVTISTSQSFAWQTFSVIGVRFSVTAVALAGENIRLRRLRVINFGTRTPLAFDGSYSYTGPNRTYEGFPLRIDGRREGRPSDKPSFNSVIEDCVIEQPYPSPGREVTFVVGGGVATWADPTLTPPEKLHLEPFGCGIRNCYMNFEFKNPLPGNPIAIDDPLVFSGSNPTTVTVKTRFPHRFSVGEHVEFVGGGVPALNNRFQVKSIGGTGDTPWAERLFTFEITPQPGQPSGVSVFSSPLQTMPVSLTRSGSTVTVTTAAKHKRTLGDLVVINGVTPDEYNGTFPIASVVTDYVFTYLVIPTPAADPSGEPYLDRRPNGFVRIQSVGDAILTSGEYYASVATFAPHYRKVGDWITVNGIQCGNGTPAEKLANAYNNYVEITSVTDRLNFTVRLPSNRNTTGTPRVVGQDSGFGTNYQATYANGGFGGGVLSNRIANANRGSYHDYYWHRHFIARKNYFYNVYHCHWFAVVTDSKVAYTKEGTYEDSDPAMNSNFATGTVTSQGQSPPGSDVVVTLDTPGADPGFLPGVVLQIIHDSNQDSARRNVYVTQIPSALNGKFRFVFRNLTDRTFAFNDLITAYLWFQQSLILFDSNILEMALAPKGGVSVVPLGIGTIGPYWENPPTALPIPPQPNPYIIGPVHGLDDGWIVHEAIIRDNLIRKIGNGADPDNLSQSFGIRMNSCQRLIVEGNLIGELNSYVNPPSYFAKEAHELAYSMSETYKSFSNRFPNGKLRQLFNDPSWYGNTEYWVDEIETNAQDMFLNLFRKRRIGLRILQSR